ncbi:MAG: hypothetical protein IJ225_00230 [Solobacterium sp.]|nr:hypothetical protein [Solobacterium sp.]
MRFIFMALQKEAAPLIQALNLKQVDGAIRCFQNEDTVLSLTGTGPLTAAAVTASVLERYQAKETDLLINAGWAGSLQSAHLGQIFRIHRIHDYASNRDYYPDVSLSSITEASLITLAFPFTSSMDRTLFLNTVLKEASVLCDMEASGIFEAAHSRLPLHRMKFLKIVSDLGEKPEETVLSKYSSNLCETVLHELEESELPVTQPNSSFEQLEVDLCASVTMRRQLRQLLHYCSLAEIEITPLIQRLYEEGNLPASDRAKGKQILEVLYEELLP